MNDLKVTRQTASKALAEYGFVEKHRAGRSNYYINVPVVALFMDDSV